jgi:hypothetical protein
VESAQAQLWEARAELGAVVGMTQSYEDLGKLADQTQSFWHTLNGRFQDGRGAWDLDRL